ncbi:MAG: SAM-dependent methyltransferase [Chloroflexota bacterium]
MKTIVRDWDWWAYLFRVVHRQQIPGISEWDDRLIAFIVALLELKPGSCLLDVACGSGVHLLRLAQRGIEGVGVEIAPSLVRHGQEQAVEIGVAHRLRYLVGDMRHLAAAVGDETFDAVTLLSGSFGFFDDATNQQVLDGLAARLKPGGRLLLDCVAPAQAMQPGCRSWSAYGGGIGFRESWFDPITCSLCSDFRFLDADGVMNLCAEPERIRVYSLPELKAMISYAGLEFVAAYANHALPAVPYDIDHSDRLVVVAGK